MKSETHPSTNLLLAPDLPPSGAEAARLVAHVLPITQTQLAGLPALVTFWRPTAAEILQLAEGGMVELWVYAERMPLVGLGVEASPTSYGHAH